MERSDTIILGTLGILGIFRLIRVRVVLSTFWADSLIHLRLNTLLGYFYTELRGAFFIIRV
jgi:hypothetical protein